MTTKAVILNVTIDAKNSVLINLYNPNTENEQVEVLNALLTSRRLQCFFLIQIYNVVEAIRFSNKNPLPN